MSDFYSVMSLSIPITPMTKIHLLEILPVLICKWKIHELLSAVHASIYYPTLKSTSSQLSLSGCHSSRWLLLPSAPQSIFWSHGGAGTLQPRWAGLIRGRTNSTIRKHASNHMHKFTSL